MMPVQEDAYEYVIEPSRGWLNINWRELFHYKDLILLFVRRDFTTKYKQTMLGPVWFLVQPLLTTGIYAFVFARAARVSTAGLPALLFYLSGLLWWGYFSQCFTTVSATFSTNINLYSKIYFPRLALPIAAILSNLITFIIQLALFAVIYIYYSVFISTPTLAIKPWAIVVLPLLLLQVAVAAFGLGLISAGLTAKYRDLSYLSGFLIQIGMFATPIIYPLAIIPEKWRSLVILNPLAVVIETFRSAFFTTPLPHPQEILTSGVISITLLVLGLLLFNRAERTFVDTV